MAWAAVAGAVAGPLIGGMMGGGGSDGQGGQQQTVSKDPWSAADPWLRENIKSGQALQNRYAVTPFNAQQVQGYNNQYGNADYMRSLTSSVLGQLNGFQPFDRNNQSARPQAFQFPDTQQATPGIQQIAAPSPYMQAPMPALVAAPVAAQAPVADAAPSAEMLDWDYQKWKRQHEAGGYNTPDLAAQLTYDSYNKKIADANFWGGAG